MIPIEKGQEPQELLAYRKQRFASYRDMPGNVKAAIKRGLVREQGHLCAYCMSRLKDAGLEDPGSDDVTIEHWRPQRPAGGEVPHDPLDYRNMLAVCNGNRGGHRSEMTCDASRGNKPLTVNPLDKGTLSGIYYHKGEIHSTDAEVEKDLVTTLNLNCEAVSLPQRRLAALHAMQTRISKERPGRGASRRMLQRMLESYKAENDSKPPYVGILTWWLEKRLQRP